ncbi:MAG TPA: amino acid adenylation domain-containing protein, partial [Longimicrobiaceae bacterium]|nr:amino acid adenylation domain-containing protein [Longimicrobiaceae bacterium]
VVVGTPFAGRTLRETEEVIGLFLNSLALRVDLSGDPSFAGLLARVREATLGAFAHQDVPFERVLDEVRPERDLSRSPVFQVMLNLTNFEEARVDVPGLEVEGLGAVDDPASKFDLTLYASEGPEGILANLLYDADLFAPARMRALLAQLRAVLAQAVDDPARPLSAFSLATDDAATVLPDPARRIEPEPWRGAVHEAFAARAAETPDAAAVVDGGERWTYAALDAAANRVAHRLVEGGVRPGEVVAVHAHRSAALVRALLGAWKAGAAFAVLDPAYPPARLAAQVRAARPAALLHLAAAGEVPGEVAAALAESARTTLVLAAEGNDGLDGFPSTAPAVPVDPDGLAYVAFTSGTTGAPKAIAGTHRPLAHFFAWYAQEFGLAANDRFSLLSGLAHDPLLRDLFAPLTAGGCIAIPDAGEIGTPGWLAGWMREAGVTVAHLTPAMAQLLASASGARLPALRLACFGGDVLRVREVERLRAVAPNAEAANFYGATETPQAVACFRLPADLSAAGPVVPVGRGIDGVDLLVVSPSGGLAGIGELGEIAVRTPYLSRGYLNDPELTAARFVPNPVTGDPADRVYLTGDLGRYRPDGAVEPAGRADGQVKVRGFRVELGEVEAALARHASVREAVAAVHGEGDDRVLAAYIVAPGMDGVDEALRAHLASLLPAYMVPSAFVAIAAVPLTANGKVDRRALPAPERTDAPAPDAPLSPTEEAVAAIWREVLGVGVVRPGDDFFRLGGHSLRATQVLSRIQERLGVTVPVRTFFAAPTLAGLAAAVDALRPGGVPAQAGKPAAPAYPPGVYPLSFAQQRVWVLMQLGTSAAYNVVDALRFTGPLDDRVLEYALTEVVRRHEPLRTRIELSDGEPVQVVLPARPVRLRAEAVDAPAGEARDAAYARAAEEEALQEFPAEGPFFRARLLRAGDDDHVLLWTVHHVATDGWSQGLFRAELLALYRAFARDEGSPLPELPTTYGRYALRQREELGGGAMDHLAAWWRERLAGAPELLELPTDHPRPAEPSGRGDLFAFTLGAGMGARVDAFAREHGATPFMVLLAAWQAGAGPVVRAGRRGRGHSHRQPHPARAGGAGGLLRQHAGAARRPLRRPRLRGADGAGARDHAGSVRAPGPAVRAAGGGAAPGALAGPRARLPGHVRPAERARRVRERAAGGRRRLGRGARAPHLHLRPVAGAVSARRLLLLHRRVFHRPLRGGHRPADDGAARRAPGCRARRARRPPLAAPAALGRGPRRCARPLLRPARRRGRRHRAGPDRRADGRSAGRPRGRRRRRGADLRGAGGARRRPRRLPAGARRRPRVSRRHRDGAGHRAGRLGAGRAEGGRGLRPRRPRLSRGAHRVDAFRFRRGRRSHPGDARRPHAGGGRSGDRGGRGVGAGRVGRGGRGSPGRGPSPLRRVPHLHLGIDGASEGRGEHARGAREPGPRARRAGGADGGGPRAPVLLVLLRRLGGGDLPDLGGGGGAGLPLRRAAG